jgi:hypothetical protein
MWESSWFSFIPSEPLYLAVLRSSMFSAVSACIDVLLVLDLGLHVVVGGPAGATI